ncbi:ECF transporter S component [Bacillus massiliigorillae]|uniref:ECF transporter S component n=1 Tax=Bacillus massiliigorillae TaxID=1243664 RepID=UPI0005AA35E5|nr:ECF transporter S component [Bacillus massiliigorillae]
MKIQKITLCSLFVAMCFIGGNIKFMGSIALDAAPALIGTLLLGPYYGMALGFFGHIISSLLSGFPLSLPVHLIIALMMALTMYFYSVSRRWLEQRVNHVVAIIGSGVVMFLFNCPISLLALYPLIKDMAFVLFPALALAALCNLVIAEIVYVALPLSWKKKFMKM